MFKEPKLLHAMLKMLADNIGEYANFQIESGAQVSGDQGVIPPRLDSVVV